MLPAVDAPANSTIVVGVTVPHGTTISLSDSLGATYTLGCAADAGTGDYLTAVYAAPAGTTGGQDVIDLGVGTTSIQPVQYVVSVFLNLATSSVLNGSKCTAGITPNASTYLIDPGSFTPTTNNNANGGNVIWNYTAPCAAVTSNPTNWVAASGFTLLNGELEWVDDFGWPYATQWETQTTRGAVDASITSTGDDTDCYNSATVALLVANNSAVPPTTIHVAKVIHVSSGYGLSAPTTIPVKFPTVGNLRVLGAGWQDGEPGGGSTSGGQLTSVTSSDGCAWTMEENGGVGSGAAQIWYAQNCSPNPTLIVSLGFTGSGGQPQWSVRFWDIENAQSSSFVNQNGGQGACVVGANDDQPTITPGVSAGPTIDIMGDGTGPVTGLASGAPSGAVFDLWTLLDRRTATSRIMLTPQGI